MNRLEEQIKYVFEETGRTVPGWRVEVTDREIIGRSDWAKIIVHVYKPRKRKPAVIWELAINFVRGIIDWEHSSFCYPK